MRLSGIRPQNDLTVLASIWWILYGLNWPRKTSQVVIAWSNPEVCTQPPENLLQSGWIYSYTIGVNFSNDSSKDQNPQKGVNSRGIFGFQRNLGEIRSMHPDIWFCYPPKNQMIQWFVRATYWIPQHNCRGGYVGVLKSESTEVSKIFLEISHLLFGDEFLEHVARNVK